MEYLTLMSDNPCAGADIPAADLSLAAKMRRSSVLASSYSVLFAPLASKNLRLKVRRVPTIARTIPRRNASASISNRCMALSATNVPHKFHKQDSCDRYLSFGKRRSPISQSRFGRDHLCLLRQFLRSRSNSSVAKARSDILCSESCTDTADVSH